MAIFVYDVPESGNYSVQSYDNDNNLSEASDEINVQTIQSVLSNNSHYLNFSGLEYFYNTKIVNVLQEKLGSNMIGTQDKINLLDDTDIALSTKIYNQRETAEDILTNKVISTAKFSDGTKISIENNTLYIPAYPTSLPASDVSEWAKEQSKPTYTKEEVGIGTITNEEISNLLFEQEPMLPAKADILSASQVSSNGNVELSIGYDDTVDVSKINIYVDGQLVESQSV